MVPPLLKITQDGQRSMWPPDSLYQHVLIGDSTTQTITIHNTGDTDLQWEIAASNSQRISSDNNIYLTTTDQGPNISLEDGPGAQAPGCMN
ncbi:hypothetical protein Ct9H90mP12_3450 [bacterium]|nr:MAG: hypothetical protein Ct9H90mP12_3450 [bacterium]